MSVFMFVVLCVLYVLIGILFAGFLYADEEVDCWCIFAAISWPLLLIVLVGMWIGYPIFTFGKKLGKRYMDMENKLTRKED